MTRLRLRPRTIAVEQNQESEQPSPSGRTAPKIPADAGRADMALKRNRRYLVGYVGVMGDADGVHYFIDAAKHLVHEMKRNDVQFLLMGTGPEYPRLIEQRDRLGLREYVDMPGRVSNEALFEGLSTMDLGVSCDPINPYNDHCTMNKVLEYMALRNSSLQGAYFMLAARALGLDCGPMSGFDNTKVDAAFFPGGRIKSNFLCNLGYGDPAKLPPFMGRRTLEENCSFA